MKIAMEGKKISSILTVLPQNEYGFEENILAESMKRVERLRRVMGFNKRRRVKRDTVVTDLISYGFNHLIDKGIIKKEEVGAIICTSLTPDYYAPNSTSVLHGKFGLSDDVLCLDVIQGCAGYVVGLLQACLLLDKMPDKKVLIFTGEVFNKKYAVEEEKTSTPNFGGDAASVSVIENCDREEAFHFVLRVNGKDGDALLMPGGAFWHPMYPGEVPSFTDANGEEKGYLSTNMEGSAVFNFIQKEVPGLIEDTLNFANMSKDEVDYFLFHQPNRYILEKLAERMEVGREKMPMNIVEKYGNSNSSTVPMVITDNCSDVLVKEKKKCCLSGFGSGLSWGAVAMNLGNLDVCEMIESPF